MTGMPFAAACLAIGLVLSWLGTLAFPKHPGWVAAAIDVLIVYVISYLPPFKLPGSSCGALWSSCNPSWGAIGTEYSRTAPHAYVIAGIILAAPFVMCWFFASRAAGARPALRGRPR